jgi:ribosome-binding factor A
MREEGSYIYGSEVLVSVTRVMMSPDLGLAKIYVSVFNTENKSAVILLLNEEKVRLKQQFTQRIRKHVRRIPRIDIYLDDTLDEMDKIDELLNSL